MLPATVPLGKWPSNGAQAGRGSAAASGFLTSLRIAQTAAQGSERPPLAIAVRCARRRLRRAWVAVESEAAGLRFGSLTERQPDDPVGTLFRLAE